MSLRFIFGLDEDQKLDFMIDDIKNNMDKDIIFIVPEQYTVLAERNIVNRANLAGLLNIEVLSPKSLASRVLNIEGGINKPLIKDEGKIMILKKVISQISKELTLYEKASSKQGFLKDINNVIKEFKTQNIKYENLLLEIDNIDDLILREKLKDISRIYEEFEKQIEKSYVNSDDLLNILNEKLVESEFFKEKLVYIYKFNNFTNQMIDMIDILIQKSKMVSISINLRAKQRYPDEFEFLKSERILYNKFLKLAAKNSYDIEYEFIKEDFKNKDIEFLKEEFFSYKKIKYNTQVDNISLYKSNKPIGEIEKIAKKINYLIRNKNYKYKDFAIISNDINLYSSFIRRVFYNYDIPYFLDEKRDIMSNPLILYIISSLNIINKNFNYDDVLRFIKTGYTSITKEEGEYFENFIIKRGIKGKKYENIFEDEVFNEIRDRLFKNIYILQNKVSKKNSIMNMVKGVYEFLEAENIYEKLEKKLNTLEEKNLFEYLEENKMIWNIVLENLKQLMEILKDDRVSLDEFIKILSSGFFVYELKIIPTRIDEVLIGNLNNTKIDKVKGIFVIGLNDMILPSNFSNEKILLEEDKKSLENLNMKLNTLEEIKSEVEMFNFYKLMSFSKEFIDFSYSMSDKDSNSLRPSIYVNRIKKLMNIKEVEEAKELDFDESILTNQKTSIAYLVKALSNGIKNGDLDEKWIKLYYYLNKNYDIKFLRDGLDYNNNYNALSKNISSKLYKIPISTSVSRLELFSNCPFAHFIRYGVKPKKKEEFEIRALEMGEFFHSSINSFTKEIYKKNLNLKDINDQNIEDITNQAVNELIESYKMGVFKSNKKNEYLVKRLKRVTKRAIKTLVMHVNSSEFKILGSEISFGYENSKYPQIEIELSDGQKIYIQGKIDRLDSFSDIENEFIKIIDYKSSSKDIELYKVYEGLQLQLLIYLDAILKSSEKNKAGGIFYFKIDDPLISSDNDIKDFIEDEINKKLKMKGVVLNDINIIKAMDKNINRYSNIIPVTLKKDNSISKTSNVLSEYEFNILIDHCKNLIRDIGDKITDGNIDVEPKKIQNQTSCDYCDYKSICLFDEEFENNKFKSINKKSNQEIIDILKEDKKGDNNG